MKIERNDVWPKDITIKVETDSFGVAPIEYDIFTDIVNNINSFCVTTMISGKTRLYFGLRGIFTEI